jgi:hypothetical protein
MQTVKNREKYYKEAFKPLVEYFKDQFKGKLREVSEGIHLHCHCIQ